MALVPEVVEAIARGSCGLVDAARAAPALALLILVLAAAWARWAGAPQKQTPGGKDVGLEPDAGEAEDGGQDWIADFMRRHGAPTTPHEECSCMPGSSVPVFSNPQEPSEFETEVCRCKFLSLHRPTFDRELDKSGRYMYGEHFSGKKRLWEARIQLQFKKVVRQEDVFFGIEAERFVPMSKATQRMRDAIVGMLKRVVCDQVYTSPGDDPVAAMGAPPGLELERPVFVMPLWAFDQFIFTEEGQEPPALNDPGLPSMGSARTHRVRDFKAELERLELKPGPTYTFCFWGVSQWLDKINWKAKMPLGGSIDLDKLCGALPAHAVCYSLKPRDPSGKFDSRHLQSRKEYLFDLAFWSSKRRPKAERLMELFGTERSDGALCIDKPCQSPGPVGALGSTPTLLGQLRPLATHSTGKRARFSGFPACCSGR